jgi:hypothetical protein
MAALRYVTHKLDEEGAGIGPTYVHVLRHVENYPSNPPELMILCQLASTIEDAKTPDQVGVINRRMP